MLKVSPPLVAFEPALSMRSFSFPVSTTDSAFPRSATRTTVPPGVGSTVPESARCGRCGITPIWIPIAAPNFVTPLMPSMMPLMMENRTVLANGQASRSQYITSRGWFGFDPGANVITFAASGPAPSALLTATLTPAFQ